MDTNGVSITLTYDNFNRALSQSIAGATTSFTYTPDGKIVTYVKPVPGAARSASHD